MIEYYALSCVLGGFLGLIIGSLLAKYTMRDFSVNGKKRGTK